MHALSGPAFCHTLTSLDTPASTCLAASSPDHLQPVAQVFLEKVGGKVIEGLARFLFQQLTIAVRGT